MFGRYIEVEKNVLMEKSIYERGIYRLRYMKSQMKELVKDNRDLQQRLKDLMEEHDLEKSFALKALYHSEVADGGKFQESYQALDPKSK